jgi:hypothetical protein
MRELTKSMLSFTWSMSVFGLSQAVNLLSPRQAASAFDEVTRRAEEQLGPSTRQIFGVGDNLQRGFVDLTFRALGLDLFGCSSCSGGRQGRPCSCARCTQQTLRQESGWGPMPPPSGSAGAG